MLIAMGIGTNEALGSVRLSLGRGTNAADIERAAAELARAWHELVHLVAPDQIHLRTDFA
jgi:cysteine desulfurase